MVTLVNYNSSESVKKYNFIFEKAWQDLKIHNKLDTTENANQTQFEDLGHYFSYLKELISLDPIYIMLPADEDSFDIDANTRIIKVPPNFARCSGVQSDNYAEIVTFTIDRYFDYQDLSNLNIAVQWINAKGRQGVSFIDLIDLETLKTKHQIRFGWPLSAEMTEAAGNLTFAVRFFKTSVIDGEETFEYVFNTAPATIPIKSTLNVQFYGDDSVVKKFNDYSLFKDYVESSPNPSHGLPTRTTIVEKLPEDANLVNNELTLFVQAATKNRNPLTYEWKYCENPENPQDYIILTPTTINKLGLASVYKIENGWTRYNPEFWPENKPNCEFWTPVLDEDNNPIPGFYEEYTGAWPIQLEDGEEKPLGAVSTDEVTLFLLRSNLKILPHDTAKITGDYYVTAYNIMGSNNTSATSGPCEIRPPADVELEKNFKLDEHRFLVSGATDTLVLKFKNDPQKPVRKVSLYNADSTTVDEDGLPVPVDSIETTDNEVAFIINTWGNYYFKVEAKANRTPKTLTTDSCFITDYAAIPGLKELSMVKNNDIDTKVTSTSANSLTIDGNVRDSITLTAGIYNLTDDNGTEYTVKVKNQDGSETDKTFVVSKYNISNALTYKWEVFISDVTKDYMPVKEAPIELIDKEADVSGPSITVNVLQSSSGGEETKPVYTYRCTVTNKFADMAESRSFFFYVV